MAQWYVKELSKLTQVSVQTLHHYDRIGLLKPSVRLTNGYRLYSEKDLLKLQQIIALKFFGFELAKIKLLLCKDVDMIEHFTHQSHFLEEKAKSLIEANQALKNIISDCDRDKSIPWETIIHLIEVYRMMQELEKTWAGKVLSQDELKQYANFMKSLKDRFTDTEKERCEQDWRDIVEEVNASLKIDPTSEQGMALGKRCMDWVNHLYGKTYVGLRNTIWRKGFKGGHVGAEHHLTSESIAWLSDAMNAYHKSRIYGFFEGIGRKPQKILLKQWDELLDDFCGDDINAREEIFDLILKDDQVSEDAKNWVRKYIEKK